MTVVDLRENPFAVTTPESMSAKDAVDLFVDVFTDFPKVPRPGHVFLHGPRGCGKSMMFRYLQPDCQVLACGGSLQDLPFYSIYIPLKNTDFKLTELLRLDGQHASTLLNEHYMVMSIAQATFDALSKQQIGEDEADWLQKARSFANDSFRELLRSCGWAGAGSQSLGEIDSVARGFAAMADTCTTLFVEMVSYVKKLAFSRDVPPYEGPLCGYIDFLHPLLCSLKDLPFMPRGPIFLLIDDADNLNLTQTRILNSWVASRTSSDVSIKISTQLQYKTVRTVAGHTIDSPHDYSEVNVSTIYTSQKGTYRDRVREIVTRRLKHAGIDHTPDEFFPVYEKQEKAIAVIAKSYKDRWDEHGRGHRASDDATRYARPDYIARLAGPRKSTHTYRYAGFDQLIHISSGVIRYFLEAAAEMYSEVKAQPVKQPVMSIPSRTQDTVIRRQADAFFFNEYARMMRDDSEEAPPGDVTARLFNLIRALGGTFYQILVSDKAERRVFSVAFSDEPSDDILQVIRLGERLGYFHVSAMGNKDGTGRTPLYILSRRLAPHFKLDPTSFAGYLFVTSSTVSQAMQNPNALLRKIKADGVESVFETLQLKLFEEAD